MDLLPIKFLSRRERVARCEPGEGRFDFSAMARTPPTLIRRAALRSVLPPGEELSSSYFSFPDRS
jgi:hypothetical protein